jgi:dTDP-4-dehydrorhamnose reductase
MKVLITGANGQVAFELQRIADRRPFDIFALTKEQFDLTQLKLMSVIFDKIRPDVVINTAAYTHVDKAESHVETTFAVNRNGVENLAQLCEKYHCPLIQLSTDYVFDGSKNLPYSEEDSVAPINCYGMSKWEGEEVIRKQLEQHLIVRVSAVFGTHGHNFVKTILRLSHEKKQLRIVNDQITCPTPAQAIAHMLWQLCIKIRLQPVWGTYHYCALPAVSWYEFAQSFVKNIEPIASSAYPTIAKRPRYSVLNCQKIKKIYNIQQIEWQMGLNDVIQQLSAP